jgi:hypothetical protein
MRDYGKVSPQFWVGRTGKALRGDMEAQLVALYLMTSPHANMIGVYYCPIEYVAKETGIPLEGASKALRRLIDADFCTYEADSEWIFVHKFAENQIGEELKATDKRVQGVVNELAKIPKDQCWQSFRAMYAVPFNLPPLASPSEAPSKPLRSQKQKQKQEQKEAASQPFVLPDWIPEDSWNGYVDMRVKKRAQMTDRARELVIAELLKFRDAGHDVGAILDKSTKGNWTDVYEPKSTPATARQADAFAGAL